MIITRRMKKVNIIPQGDFTVVGKSIFGGERIFKCMSVENVGFIAYDKFGIALPTIPNFQSLKNHVESFEIFVEPDPLTTFQEDAILSNINQAIGSLASINAEFDVQSMIDVLEVLRKANLNTI